MGYIVYFSQFVIKYFIFTCVSQGVIVSTCYTEALTPPVFITLTQMVKELTKFSAIKKQTAVDGLCYKSVLMALLTLLIKAGTNIKTGLAICPLNSGSATTSCIDYRP